jgi:hypothetical protein
MIRLDPYSKNNRFCFKRSRYLCSYMPTGAENLFFQVPAMMKNLLGDFSLFTHEDQVANLQKRNIKAIALTGGIRSEGNDRSTRQWFW